MLGSQSRSRLESSSIYSLKSHKMDLFDRFSRFFHGTFFCKAQIENSNFNIRILNRSSPINNLFENLDLHFGILLRTLATGLILPLGRQVPRKPRPVGGVKGHNKMILPWLTFCSPLRAREAPRCGRELHQCLGTLFPTNRF